jgi:hypothetical protein
MTTKEQRQVQKQIPFGNDKQIKDGRQRRNAEVREGFAEVRRVGLGTLCSTEEHQEDGFLGVEAVFGLVEYGALGAV